MSTPRLGKSLGTFPQDPKMTAVAPAIMLSFQAEKGRNGSPSHAVSSSQERKLFLRALGHIA